MREVQGRSFFSGDTGSSVKASSAALVSERDWLSEDQELRKGLSNLSRETSPPESHWAIQDRVESSISQLPRDHYGP